MAADHSILWPVEIKRAYAAGILDGEGCVTIAGTPQSSGYRLYVQLGQAIKGWALLEFMNREFGGKISNPYQPPGGRALKRECFWTNEEAYDLLKDLRPYLLFKGTQADLGFQFHEAVRKITVSGRVRWTTSAKEMAQEFQRQIKFLNRKGIQLNVEAKPPDRSSDNDLFSGLPCA